MVGEVVWVAGHSGLFVMLLTRVPNAEHFSRQGRSGGAIETTGSDLLYIADIIS